MQHHPVIRNLRNIGVIIGVVLFVFMAYRSGRSAQDPIAVKGKPNASAIAAADLAGTLPGTTLTSLGADSKVSAAGANSSHKSAVSTAVSTDTHSVADATTTVTNNGGNVVQGKALGIYNKHQN